MKNTRQITIETLTPIHIGSGQSLHQNFEYIYDNEIKKVFVIDDSKMLDVIGEDKIGAWVAAIDNGKLSEFLRFENKADIAHREIEVPRLGPVGNNELKEQIHAGAHQQPMIPGSSLKGPVRTAILRKLILENPNFARQTDKYMQRRGNRVRFKDHQIIAHYFGQKDRTNFRNEIQLDANRDFMRMIRITDAYFPKNLTECHKLEVINEFRRGWSTKDREASFIECIPRGVQASSSIQVPQQLLKLILNGKFPKTEMIKKHEALLSINMLFKIINNYTLALLDREIGFWEDEGNPKAIGDYLEELQELESQVKSFDKENPSSCIMRVGAGSGWDFMTGSWATSTDPEILTNNAWDELKEFVQKRDYRGNAAFPKTRKLIMGGSPLGFVKIKAI